MNPAQRTALLPLSFLGVSDGLADAALLREGREGFSEVARLRRAGDRVVTYTGVDEDAEAVSESESITMILGVRGALSGFFRGGVMRGTAESEYGRLVRGSECGGRRCDGEERLIEGRNDFGGVF